MQLILPLPPSANRYYRNVRGVMVKSAEARAYRIAVGRAMLEKEVEILSGALSVTLRVFRARKSGDLDNRIKIALDSLNGVCWHDDKQVEEIHAYRFDDAFNPRLEISVLILDK